MQIPSSPNLKPFLNLGLDHKTEKKSSWFEPLAPNPLLQFRQQSMKSMSNSRKAAAQQKLAELKMRLEAMMKFAGIGKGNPTEAIRLAKELSAAIRAYGGGGGGGGAGGAVAMAMPQVAAAPASAEAGVSADTVNSTATVAVDSASTPPAAEAGEIQAAEQSAALALADAEASSKLAQSLNVISGSSNEDKAFLNEAKTLMGRIKMLIALETKKAEDEKKGSSAIAEMEKALSDAPQNLATENAAMAESSTEYSAAGVSVSPTGESSSVSISV